MIITNGTQIADSLLNKIANNVSIFKSRYRVVPKLMIIEIGDHLDINIQVNKIIKDAEKVGMKVSIQYFHQNISREELQHAIKVYNENLDLHGILILSYERNVKCFFHYIYPEIDVNACTEISLGKILSGVTEITPPKLQASMMIIKDVLGQDLARKNVVIFNVSDKQEGMVLMAMFLKENCTVTLVPSFEVYLEDDIKRADILFSPFEIPHFIKQFIRDDCYTMIEKENLDAIQCISSACIINNTFKLCEKAIEYKYYDKYSEKYKKDEEDEEDEEE